MIIAEKCTIAVKKIPINVIRLCGAERIRKITCIFQLIAVDDELFMNTKHKTDFFIFDSTDQILVVKGEQRDQSVSLEH